VKIHALDTEPSQLQSPRHVLHLTPNSTLPSPHGYSSNHAPLWAQFTAYRLGQPRLGHDTRAHNHKISSEYGGVISVDLVCRWTCGYCSGCECRCDCECVCVSVSVSVTSTTLARTTTRSTCSMKYGRVSSVELVYECHTRVSLWTWWRVQLSEGFE
jgi:hypothetical protein